MPVTVNKYPTCCKYTCLCVVVVTVLGIEEDTCELNLANVDTVAAEVVEVTVYLSNAVITYALYVVSKTAVLVVPAVLQCIFESVSILKLFVNVAEVCNTFGGGGHIKAAGATMTKDLEESKNMILGAVIKTIK